MAGTIFITLEQVLAIHHDQIEKYGGTHGIRDLNLLESAVQRPQSSFMGEDLYPTVFDKAAALLHSILLNHPFLDANKRTSMVSASAFLHLNGFELNVDQKDFVDTALKIEAKIMDLEQISVWLKENSQKV